MKWRARAGSGHGAWRVAALWACMAACVGRASANNIQVSNVGLVDQDVGARRVLVAFDLSWENSWRGTENWDAAWVFVKFMAPGSNVWQHARLAAGGGLHRPAAGSVIVGAPDGGGAFVYGASGYTGDVSYARTRVMWEYGSNGFAFVKGQQVRVAVHAIEMVYVAPGPFYLGSGGTETSGFHEYPTSARPYLVTGETAIAVGAVDGRLYYAASAYGGDQGGPIPAAFPKGFDAFYCMKYELTQGQYCDFLNQLTGPQDAARFPNAASQNRHTISGTTTNRSVGVPDRACNYIDWRDLCAYADWAALRPMTEFEFEKACRGPAYPVPNELAWGSTVFTNQTGYVGTDGSGTETATPATGNCSFSGIAGPVRVGIFARPGSGRAGSGAGYYGAMQLSDNLFEVSVSVGHAVGRAFEGSLGDGCLTADGYADNADWPGYTGGKVSGYTGTGYRGGAWVTFGTQGPVSSRWLATSGKGRDRDTCGRFVRQAP